MAAQGGAEDVYATLLLSDTYLPGALVLAHSLRDAGTTKKLAVLVTSDTVSTEAITQLETVYHYVIPVSRIQNSQTENLHLMNRPDLHSAYTKINLWKQTQFRKIVYVDSDVVAYRAPDELFDISHPFSAAPDIGWPDLFNTGVMVLTPNMDDYNAMLAMAEGNQSFDGADQGLINMHFGTNYNRISFAYNVTPSGHYQYVPAYRHFQSDISMVHFIGPDKPWFKGRGASTGNSPYDQMTSKWWAVYDRHYQVNSLANTTSNGTTTTTSSNKPVSELVQYHTKGEYQPKTTSYRATEQVFRSHYRAPPQKVMERKQPFQPIMSSRHAQRHPPKAINLPTTVYEASQDFAPLNSPKAIFPWETRQTPPSRVFYDDPDMTDSGTLTETSTVGYQTEPATPTTPTIHITPSDSWSSFSLTNAWDEVPEIERYVDAMQKHRRKRSIKSPSTLVLPSSGEGTLDITGRRRVAKVTDFPSEAERPSLPVTPAPIRGGPGVGHGNADVPLLPAAEGVPAQSEWDPAAQLQKLARQQSEALLQKLGNRGRDSSDLPPRSLPFGSEELTSPTYVAQSGKVLSPRPVKGGVGSSAVRSIESGLGTTPGAGLMGTGAAARAMPMLEPSYTGPGAVFEKGENIPRGGVPTLRPAVPRASAGAKATTIPEPSYWGPGPSFEKDENILVAEDAH